ncbi:MAG: AzlD domain-containing protein [Cellulosilyticaceae bacterium]
MTYFVLGMLVMTVVTYLPRVIPLLLIKKPIESKWVQSFLYYIPYAVLAAMTFPAIFSSTGNFVSGVIGAIVSIGLAYFGGSLLQVSIVTVLVVYIIGWIR